MSINNLLKPSSQTLAPFDNGTYGHIGLRSYQHASRIFIDGDYQLSPKYNFLFYVEFELNPSISNVQSVDTQRLGMVVKSTGLPKYTMEVKAHNAYNRKNYVQNSIKYEPITIKFHDDQGDIVRNFWYDYYSYFYRDPDYQDVNYVAQYKYDARTQFRWGYTPRPPSSPVEQGNQYITAIRIYSLFQKNFSEYELINPIITNFRHGDHVNGESGIMEHEMTVQFETVKYYSGYTTPNTAGGYITLNYDNTPSPITPPGGTQIVDGLGTGANPGIAPDTVTDLANISTTGTLQAQATTVVGASYISSASQNAGAAVYVASSTGNNSGGTNLAGFSSFNQMASYLVPANYQIGQKYGLPVNQTAALALSKIQNNAQNAVINGVVKGIAIGTGTSTALVNLAITAIKNPSAAKQTAENMAINYATKAINTAVNSFVASYITAPIAQYGSAAASTVGGYASAAYSYVKSALGIGTVNMGTATNQDLDVFYD